jgi:hypothetical protein
MNGWAGWQWAAGLSSLGFYLFLAVWVGALIWSRTKEKLAIQETLQKLIQSGTQLSPEVIDALRRPKPGRTVADIRSRVRKFRYWGIFLVGLGTVVALNGLKYADSPVKDLRELSGTGIVLFVIPGLFCLAHSVITSLVNRPENQ